MNEERDELENTENYDDNYDNNTSNKSSLTSASLGLLIKKLPLKVKIIIAGVVIGLSLFLLLILCGAAYISMGQFGKDDNDTSISGLGSDLATAYSECTSVKVEGQPSPIPLEDYVMGVVSGESYPKGIEAIKAQAIAIRTFTLAYTNNCTKSICNSQRCQVYNPKIRDDAREATMATAGLVLTYDSKVFLSQYDSFKGSCNSGSCTGTYVRQPKNETHTVNFPSSYRSMVAGGHGHGMSQVASYYLADQGKSYEEILKYFYSDGVQISKLSPTETGLLGGGGGEYGYKIRTTTPTASDKYFSPPYVGDHNRGQCVWYVKGRANEMFATSNLDEKTKKIAMDAITKTRGNGTDWYNNSSLSIFGQSNDITKPRAGSIIVWRYTPAYAQAKGGDYGHVAILETLTKDGKVEVTEGWSKCAYGVVNWNCVEFRYHKFNSLDELYNWIRSYNGGREIFRGYVYLFG